MFDFLKKLRGKKDKEIEKNEPILEKEENDLASSGGENINESSDDFSNEEFNKFNEVNKSVKRITIFLCMLIFHLILLFIRGWNKRHIIPARSLISLIKILLAGIIRPVVPGLRYANIMNQLSIIGNGLFIIFIAFIF